MGSPKPKDRLGQVDLKDRREAAGLTQQRLAELAGCSIAAIGLYERGYSPGRPRVLGKVLAVLDGRAQEDEDPADTGSLATATGMPPRHEQE